MRRSENFTSCRRLLRMQMIRGLRCPWPGPAASQDSNGSQQGLSKPQLKISRRIFIKWRSFLNVTMYSTLKSRDWMYDEISKLQKWAEICYSINNCRWNEKNAIFFRFKVLLTLFNYWRLMGRCAADWRHSLHFGKFQLHLRRVLARHCNATQVFQDFFGLKSYYLG